MTTESGTDLLTEEAVRSMASVVTEIALRDTAGMRPGPSSDLSKVKAFLLAYDTLRSAWSFRQAAAIHADNEKYAWACRRFDDAFDEADRARSLLAKLEGKS